jgi:hypothetical protein
MKLVMPREVVFDLDPLAVTAPLNMQAVFRSIIAKPLWFMLEDEGPSVSTQKCLYVAGEIDKAKVTTLAELETQLGALGIDTSNADALLCLFDAMYGARTIIYKIYNPSLRHLAMWL